MIPLDLCQRVYTTIYATNIWVEQKRDIKLLISESIWLIEISIQKAVRNKNKFASQLPQLGCCILIFDALFLAARTFCSGEICCLKIVILERGAVLFALPGCFAHQLKGIVSNYSCHAKNTWDTFKILQGRGCSGQSHFSSKIIISIVFKKG